MNWYYRNIRYPSDLKNYQSTYIPYLIGGDIKLCLGSNEFGYIFFWKGNFWT